MPASPAKETKVAVPEVQNIELIRDRFQSQSRRMGSLEDELDEIRTSILDLRVSFKRAVERGPDVHGEPFKPEY